MRILQAANFIAPGSGGLRTTLDALAHGYRAAGHDVGRVATRARAGRRDAARAVQPPVTGEAARAGDRDGAHAPTARSSGPSGGGR